MSAETPEDREVEPTLEPRPSAERDTMDYRQSTPHPSSGSTPGVAQEWANKMLGDYELMERLGAGGMGVVYRARQRSANRIVALKVIRPERLADLSPASQAETLQRFLTEAQAAARLEHDHIVTVYDVGTADGQPFYSMRYVEGRSLADVLRDGPLENRRAATFLEPVARAVHYAHECRILHRDLKPQNVMLDAAERPYVADFGLAKLTESASDMTRTGQIMGTPAYMSPEQAQDASRCTPASDIYSLGATLYDLLTGRPPFRAATVVETLKQVIEQEPVAPQLLNPAIDRDLETITLKCLSKEPSRRYTSAAELADDLRRYQNREPIHARPVSLPERAWRWSRRYPAAAGAIAAVLLGLLSVSTLLWIVSSVNNDLVKSIASETKAREAETEAKNEAVVKQAEAEKARDDTEQVLDYLVAVFRKSDPSADGEKLTVAELLDQAAEQMETKFPNRPLIQARLLNAIGQTYRGLGLYQKAVAVCERARDLRRNQLGEDHEDTLRSMNNLALAYASAGRPGEAASLLEQTLELTRAKLGSEHEDTLRSMNNLALAYHSAGRHAESLPLFEQTLQLTKVKLTVSHSSTIKTMTNLAAAYESAGRLSEAVPLYEQALELMKATLGPKHPTTLTVMNNLALAYNSAGRLAEALPLLEQTLDLMKAKLGPEHPDTLTTMNNLATACLAAERPEKGLPLLAELIAIRRKGAAADGPGFARSLAAVSLDLLNRQQYLAAETYLRECLMIREKALPEDWSLFETMSMLGGALAGQKKFQEAEPLLLEGYSGMKDREAKIPPDAKTRLAESLERIVQLYDAWGKPDQAADWRAKLSEAAKTEEKQEVKKEP